MNIDLPHLLAFALMAYMYIKFSTIGYRQLRVVAFLFLWQMLTPTRSALIDIPMMIACLVAAEISYLWITKRLD